MHLDDFLLTAGRIDPHAWAARRGDGSDPVAIGECHCHALVFPDRISVDGYGRRFYEMTCAAGHEAAVPADSVVRSARTMPIYGVAWHEEREAAVA